MVPSLLLIVPASMAAEITVGATGDYATIGEAVAVAGYYDTITVQPGSYTESFWLGSGATVQAEQGLGSVTIDGSGATSRVISITSGTVRGVIVANAAEVGFLVQGDNAVLEQSAVVAPGSQGVSVIGASPTITEVAVYDAGTDAFSFSGGTPSARRCLAVDPAGVGFSIATAGAYDNLVSIGATAGFQVSAPAELLHVGSLDGSLAGLLAESGHTVTNALIVSNPVSADCQGFVVDLGYSLLNDAYKSRDCPAIGLHDNLYPPPDLMAWRSGQRPPLVDLRPATESPMIDSGSGVDPDHSAADIGPFGGTHGVWTDADGDGSPIHFDCDDQDPSANLYALEIPDGVDNDCDGDIDEQDPQDDTGLEPQGEDLDGDGYTDLDGDCEDHNLATYPGAPELFDGADNDCDGSIDEGAWYVDDDGDGASELDGDCDDHDASRAPGLPEQGEDGIDHDCDGVADGVATLDGDGDGWTIGAGDCDDSRPGVHPEAFDGLDGVDGDCDGVTDDDGLAWDGDHDGVTVGELDCDDGDISISPTSPERADDGIDQDCDGVDLYDVDGDGHAAPAAGGGDCDDEHAEVYPGADEICDGLDNDCDDDVDEFCTDSELDGPPRDPWEPGIHSGCNCASAPGQLPRPAWLLILSCGLIATKRRSDHVDHA